MMILIDKGFMTGEVLWPSQPIRAMSGRSVYLITMFSSPESKAEDSYCDHTFELFLRNPWAKFLQTSCGALC